jgi:hypothetical protein
MNKGDFSGMSFGQMIKFGLASILTELVKVVIAVSILAMVYFFVL